MLESDRSHNFDRGIPPGGAELEAILLSLEASQTTAADKARVREVALHFAQDPELRAPWLLATREAMQRGLNIVAPILALAELRTTLVDAGALSSSTLLAYGLVAATQEFRNHQPIAELAKPALHDMLLRGSSGEAVLAFWHLAKAFQSSLLLNPRDQTLPALRQLSEEIADLSMEADEARWVLDMAQRYAARLDRDTALTRMDSLIECLGVAHESAGGEHRQAFVRFLQKELEGSPDADPFETASLLRFVAPLLRRKDVPPELLDEYVRLAAAPVMDELEVAKHIRAEALSVFGPFIATFGDARVEKLEENSKLLRAYQQGDPAYLNRDTLAWVSAFSRSLESLEPPARILALSIAESILGTVAADAPSFKALTSVLDRAMGRLDFLEMTAVVVQLHGDAPRAEVLKKAAELRALMHPLVPSDLVRTYVEAMKDERFRKYETSRALLARLGLHAALVVLPEARTKRDLSSLLQTVGAITAEHPHIFLQEEPDAEEYRALQSDFYPQVREVYRADAKKNRARTETSKPFLLLVPPLQRSLGALLRMLDVHHGFGVQAVPARRTPDGEIPLLVRFGQQHGRVVMLNTHDNRSFPGKGFVIRNLRPEELFVARPEGFQAGQDPFALYRQAWPSIGPSIERLSKAEFLFSRGMVAMSGADPEYYSLRVGDRTLQYSLVIFNAHFENPFNEVAQLVPTEILRDFFRGAFAPLDHYTGYDSRRANVGERIPNPRVFTRHKSLGRYVINVGLPERALFGLTHSLQNEHHRWYGYRREAIDFERRMRLVDRDFALRREQFGIGRGVNHHTARALLTHDHPFDLEVNPPPKPEYERASRATPKEGKSGGPFFATLADFGSVEGANLYRREMALIAQRPQLIERFEALDSVVDEFERSAWRCVNRLMDQYDVFRIGFAYETRGMTMVSGAENSEPQEVELGDPEEAGFNPGSELMLQELYRAHSMRELGNVPRERFCVLVTGDALYSSRYDDPAVMIDSYDMKGFAGQNSVRFSEGRMDEADLGVWQAGVMPLIQDSAGRIPEIRLVERGMLPTSLLEKLDRMKGR